MITNIARSLKDLLGAAYIDRLLADRKFFGFDPEADKCLCEERVEFMPAAFLRKEEALLPYIGKKVVPEFKTDNLGAASNAYREGTNTGHAGIGSFGWYRLGEDGKLYLASKSEHYHTSMGHGFPGYKLLQNAMSLGISSAAHNLARGYITRLMEREIVRTANGLEKGDEAGLARVLSSQAPQVLNRVINIETGSLATEAAFKMMFSRFYRLNPSYAEPPYHGRVPVFMVMADRDGGPSANYHGTTMFTQYLRGLWPEYTQAAKTAGLFEICPVRINDVEDFREKLARYDKPPYKVAGFAHEIVMMNYGAVALQKPYIQAVYQLCHAADVPILCDEIQSCMWCDGMYLFRQYGLTPDFVSIGKGFPGGTYASSKLLFTAPMDTLNLFGALVTNGQNELSSLAYLITMEFAQANGKHMEEIAAYFAQQMRAQLGQRRCFTRINGDSLLLAVELADLEKIKRFSEELSRRGFEVSVQLYKPNCPNAAISKLPITANQALIDTFIEAMDEALTLIDQE